MTRSFRFWFLVPHEFGGDEPGLGATVSLSDSRPKRRGLAERATHDGLTGLANPAAFHSRLDSHFHSGVEGRTETISVLFMDVDDFKIVNDSMGHAAGDARGSHADRCRPPSDIRPFESICLI
jgi:Diguanylate cyclase, GGDEF domain